MPSPVGHAIGGLIAGWFITGAPTLTAASLDPTTRRGRRELADLGRRIAPFALLGMAPDLDLLVGLHSRYTHSLGAATLVAIITAIAWRGRAATRTPASTRGRLADDAAPPREAARDTSRLRVAIACGLAYASHVLLDWLGSDTSAPIGIMALWPWSSAFYQSHAEWFLASDRRYWLPGFVSRNLYALMWELIILVPLLAATVWLRRARGESPHDDRLVASPGEPGKTGPGKTSPRKHDPRRHDPVKDDSVKDDSVKDDPRKNQSEEKEKRGGPPRARTRMRKPTAADIDRMV